MTCETGLKKSVLEKETFEREIALCKMLSKQNVRKCRWGVCDKCGVIPLLYKLHSGQLIERNGELKKIKNELFEKP